MADLADTAINDLAPQGWSKKRTAIMLKGGSALPAVIVLLILSVASGEQSASSPPTLVEFDAVSVKLIDPSLHGSRSSEHFDPKRLVMTDTVHRLLMRAYGVTAAQIGSEPPWFTTHLYTLEGITAAPSTLSDMMIMLRAALADRFHMIVRRDERELSIYSLEVAVGGPKFSKLKQGEVRSNVQAPEGIYARSFLSLDELVNSLNNVFGGRLTVDRPVVDRTRLSGEFNIQFGTAIGGDPDEFGRKTFFPDLFHDLQSELGLKLISRRAKMPYLVIVRADPPTPN